MPTEEEEEEEEEVHTNDHEPTGGVPLHIVGKGINRGTTWPRISRPPFCSYEHVCTPSVTQQYARLREFTLPTETDPYSLDHVDPSGKICMA